MRGLPPGSPAEYLLCWREIQDDFQEASILIGNGFSINLHPAFAYKSIYEEANARGLLTKESQGLFTGLAVSDGNFERVLATLEAAVEIAGVLRQDRQALARARFDVRGSLIRTLKEVHPQMGHFADHVWDHLRIRLARYPRVYTTNYDLTLYWAAMSGSRPVGSDHFRRPETVLVFDVESMEKTALMPSFIYLHGALHLTHDLTGKTIKSESNGDLLLDRIDDDWSKAGRVPLLACEGTSASKLNTIRNSQYLSAGLSRLRSECGPLVILGHQLSRDQDQHILKALRSEGRGKNNRIAVGLYPGDPEWEEMQAKLNRDLGSGVVFFDSRCHPLTWPSLRDRASGDPPEPPHDPGTEHHRDWERRS